MLASFVNVIGAATVIIYKNAYVCKNVCFVFLHVENDGFIYPQGSY